MCKVAKLIDDRLNELGIKGSKMCDDLGISRSTLTELRKGRSKFLLPQRASQIGEYLGLDPMLLMGVENSAAAELDDRQRELAELLEEIRRNPDLRTMFSLTKNATPEEVRQYIKIIKALRGDDAVE